MFNLKSNKKFLHEEIGEKIYLDKEHNSYVIEYQDEIKLSNRKTRLVDIGSKIAQINSFFMDYLTAYNIQTGFIKSVENKLFLNNHSKFLFEIRIINRINSRLARLFNKIEEECLSIPVFEFLIGNSDDNLVNESHLISLELCTNEELRSIKRVCSKINAVLKSFFERRNCVLAEYTCKFGKDSDRIILLDSFNPKSLIVTVNNAGIHSIKKPSEFKNYVEFLINLIKQR